MSNRKRLNVDDVITAIYNDSDSERDGSSSESSESTGDEETVSENEAEPAPHPQNQQHGPVIRNRAANQPIYQNARGMRRNNAQNMLNNDFDWDVYDFHDPYSPDWLPSYQRRRSILVDTSDFSPLNFFKLYFPDTVFELMAEETNRYATQYFDAPLDLPPHSRLHKWEDTSVDEMCAMTAIQITMGLCAKPSLSEYWNGFWLTRTDLPSIMSRNRYQLLQTFLHFCDNSNRVERGMPEYNPLFKVQSLLDIVQPLYERYYCPGQNLAVDESMIKFKGRIFFKQYMPDKPTKWGFKQFVLCDSKTGYALRHTLYTGKNSFNVRPNTSMPEHVVLTLLEGYEHLGHVVFLDNFYASPLLFKRLEEMGIGACGTVRPLRKFMPEDLKPRNLALQKGDDPVFYRSNNLVACAWHDTKRVTFLSTVDTNNTIDKRVRSRREPGGFRVVEKPVLADRYNTNMAGVDLYDQLLGTYAYPHKAQKWYLPIYHTIVETALVNGYIAYRESREEEQKLLPVIEFRKKVIDGLLENFEKKVVKKCKAIPNEYVRLKERHFIQKYENKKYKPDCKVCASLRPRVRRQTCYFCADCQTPLCVVPCFELFHTYKDFKRAREQFQE